MPYIDHAKLREYGYALYEAVGTPTDQAVIVTDHLVDANLFGHDSHGMIRTPGYLRAIRSGNFKRVGKLKIVRETPASAVIDAEGALGIVVARRAMEMATERAKAHTLGAVAVHKSSHIGRLGEYVGIAAAQDCIGVVMLNGGGRFTAPFGGTLKRLPPNPIAIGVPTNSGHPLMLDITTSMTAGGKVDVRRARGEPLPDDWYIDGDGNPVTDPNRTGEPDVAMLPLGGSMGHKGYGLAVMIDAIAGGLSWAGCSTNEPTRGASGFICLAIKIESFIDIDEYKKEIDVLRDWLKSAPPLPGVEQVYLPGDVEREAARKRSAEGLFIEDATWSRLCESGKELGVTLPDGIVLK